MNLLFQKLSRALIVLGLLASSIPVIAQHSSEQAATQLPPAVVELAPVSVTNASAVLRLPGTVISTQDAQISAELSGRLMWLAEVGDKIAAGEPVATIDDHLLTLALRNNQAQIRSINTDIAYTQRQQQRLERLASQNNTAKSELDEIQSRLQMLNQDLTIAQVDRDRTHYDIERSKVTAPFAGIIVSRAMSAGEFTSIGGALLRLVNTEALEISVNAPLRSARFNHAGSVVQISGAGSQLRSSIRGVIPVGDARSRMMEVRIKLQAGQWFIGEAVTVELADSERRNTLSVPRDALVLRDNEIYVYRVSAQNTAVKVPVTTAAGLGSSIAVEGALSADDQVVVRGAENLREGQSLKIIKHQSDLEQPLNLQAALIL